MADHPIPSTMSDKVSMFNSIEYQFTINHINHRDSRVQLAVRYTISPVHSLQLSAVTNQPTRLKTCQCLVSNNNSIKGVCRLVIEFM